MDELIERIALVLSVEAGVARIAIGHVIGFLQKEFPEGPAAEFLQKTPGAEDVIAAATAAAAPASGLGGLAALLGGSAGGLFGLATQLGNAGLSSDQMRTLAREIFAYAGPVIGEENVEAIKNGVPGLSQFL